MTDKFKCLNCFFKALPIGCVEQIFMKSFISSTNFIVEMVLPKSETAKGINYCLNQEEYLKVFLSDGLNVYYYMKYLLTELTQAVRADGSIDEKDLTFTQLIRSATFIKEAIWKVLRIFQILWQIYHKCIRRMYVSGDYVLHCPPNMALVSV